MDRRTPASVDRLPRGPGRSLRGPGRLDRPLRGSDRLDRLGRSLGGIGRSLGGIGGAIVVAAVLAGCGAPPELREPAGPAAASGGPGSAAPWPGASDPAASFPGGPAPGATLPGGGLPGGALPGATLPGGGLPGGPFPDGGLPGGTLPGGPPPATADPLPTPSPRGPSAGAPAPRCGPTPTAAQVMDAVRRSPGLLPAGVRLRVRQGPYCARGWQYAVIQVVVQPEPEPLRVVTRSSGTTLTVVTAGTDVCSERVQAQAPVGIQVLACNAGPAGSNG